MYNNYVNNINCSNYVNLKPCSNCKCEKIVVNATNNMNVQILSLQNIYKASKELKSIFDIISELQEKITSDSFLHYKYEPGNLYTSFQKSVLNATVSNKYYDIAIEEILNEYKCLKNQNKYNSCIAIDNRNCEQKLKKLEILQKKIQLLDDEFTNEVSLVKDTIVKVGILDATADTKAFAVNGPFYLVLSLLNNQFNYLIESYNLKLDAYECIAKNHPTCNLSSKNCCDPLMKKSNINLDRAKVLIDFIKKQELAIENGFDQLIQATIDEDNERTKLFSNMKNVQVKFLQITKTRQEAYNLAIDIYKCKCKCSEQFLIQIRNIEQKASLASKVSIENFDKMSSIIDEYKKYQHEKEVLLKSANKIIEQLYTDTDKYTNSIINNVLTKLDEAYLCYQ